MAERLCSNTVGTQCELTEVVEEDWLEKVAAVAVGEPGSGAGGGCGSLGICGNGVRFLPGRARARGGRSCKAPGGGRRGAGNLSKEGLRTWGRVSSNMSALE